MKGKKILCALGTRPEAIKMAPIILRMKSDPSIELTVLSLGQHRELLKQMLDLFGIVPDIDLHIMQENQTLPQLTANLAVPLDETLARVSPDFVLAEGDTTSTLMTSLACAYRKIPFGHVEAGLRSDDYDNPFPEEMNRVLVSHLATLHFAPTERGEKNLLREGIRKETIFITGNPVIDALHWILKKHGRIDPRVDPHKKLILVTIHRHENWDQLIEICRAIGDVVDRNQEIQVIWPVHPNPHVSEQIREVLDRHPRILLCQPLDYVQFVTMMKHSYLILSDSGGIQEEAPALGVPVLVLRKRTERIEAVEQGFCHLIGTEYAAIVACTQELLDHPERREKMIGWQSPYGDGKAAERIVHHVKEYLFF